MIPSGRMWEVPGLSIDAFGAARTLGLRTVRSGISAALVRTGRMIGPKRLPGDEDGGPDQVGAGLDPTNRAAVVVSLEGELDDLVDDAARRGVTDHGAEALLVTAAILGWLRDGGELPGEGAIECLEIHAAIFVDARHEEERELQRAFGDVLGAFAQAQAQAIAAGRWRGRRVDVEAAEERTLRGFGANLDDLRGSRGLSIGELAERSGLDVVTVVGLIKGAESVGFGEIRLLAGALGVEPSALIPDAMLGEVADGAGTERAGPGADGAAKE
ncbi:MAG: helix-turn-helix transcriptional regulator [Actinobacteria bacterium]|nr:helix-turn-helix transcriptional regulator [Actinomycetota bacterium]